LIAKGVKYEPDRFLENSFASETFEYSPKGVRAVV
jgi:hypothetical protein